MAAKPQQQEQQPRPSVHQQALADLKLARLDNQWVLNDRTEKAFLTCILQNPPLIERAVELVQEQDFSVLRWGLLYRLMRLLYERNGGFDLATLAQQVDEAKIQHGDITNGAPDTTLWLMDFAEPGVESVSLLVYGRQIREHAVRLRLLKAADAIIKAATNRQHPLDSVIDQVIAEVDRAAELVPVANVNFRQQVERYMDSLEGKLQGDNKRLTPTGMSNIDRYGGLARREVTVLAGPAKGGKTTLALNIAQNVVQMGGFVLYFSIEMGSDELLNRVFSRLTALPKGKFRSGELTADEYRQFVASAGQVSQWKLALVDRSSLLQAQDVRVTPSRVRRALRHLRERPDLLVIDGLWLMDADQMFDRRDMEVRSITMDLSRLAVEFDVPVLLLHQYNRAAFVAEKPDITHLAEGASVERNVQTIWGMQRVTLDDGNAVTKLHVLADRNGDSHGAEHTFKYDAARSTYVPVNVNTIRLEGL